MKTTPVIVRSAVGGSSELAELATCDCGSFTFRVWKIVSQDHVHYECTECGTSFCPEGACDAYKASAVDPD